MAGAHMPAPERDLTLAEVAELRRFTPRYLRELIRRHQIPVLRSGRLIRFDALALCALEEALRQPCRSKSPGGSPPARSQSAGRLQATASSVARRATTLLLPGRKLRSLRPAYSAQNGTGNVVALAPSTKR